MSFNILMCNKTLNHAQQKVKRSRINVQLHRIAGKIVKEESYFAIACNSKKVGIAIRQCIEL